MRLQYPPSIRIVKLPCTGKVDLIHILRAVEKGADGVAVVGCLEGECRYNSGNLRAKARVKQAQKILTAVGSGAGRARMFNLTSSEAPRFVEIVSEMTEAVRALGPNPGRRGRLETDFHPKSAIGETKNNRHCEERSDAAISG